MKFEFSDEDIARMNEMMQRDAERRICTRADEIRECAGLSADRAMTIARAEADDLAVAVYVGGVTGGKTIDSRYIGRLRHIGVGDTVRMTEDAWSALPIGTLVSLEPRDPAHRREWGLVDATALPTDGRYGTIRLPHSGVVFGALRPLDSWSVGRYDRAVVRGLLVSRKPWSVREVMRPHFDVRERREDMDYQRSVDRCHETEAARVGLYIREVSRVISDDPDFGRMHANIVEPCALRWLQNEFRGASDSDHDLDSRFVEWVDGYVRRWCARHQVNVQTFGEYRREQDAKFSESIKRLITQWTTNPARILAGVAGV